MSLHKKHLPSNVSASSFFFCFTIDLIEGCAPGVVLGIKNDEVQGGIEAAELPSSDIQPSLAN
jgi:hypothetical protein